MKARRILIALLILTVVGLTFNQWRLQRAVRRLSAGASHNPGAISKVTAFLANGSEVILWEGVEPPADAPVEMSFQAPASVNAKSVKVYLDTTRVPGWNEIDAVELIGRDGSRQWAKQASASSTFAEPRVVNRERGLQRFE